MTREEEIRGIFKRIPFKGIQVIILDDYIIDWIIGELHSQGVVIKTDRELPLKIPAVPDNEWSAGYSCGEEFMQHVMLKWHNDSLEPLVGE